MQFLHKFLPLDVNKHKLPWRSHPVICEKLMCYFVFFFISSISSVSHLPISWTTPFLQIAIVKDETLNTYLRMRYSLKCWAVHTYDTSLQTCILMWHRSIWDCMPFPFVQSKDLQNSEISLQIANKTNFNVCENHYMMYKTIDIIYVNFLLFVALSVNQAPTHATSNARTTVLQHTHLVLINSLVKLMIYATQR